MSHIVCPELHKVLALVLGPIFCRLSLDVRRFVLIPMILHPYQIVACSQKQYLLRLDEDSYITGIWVGRLSRRFVWAVYGWIVQDDYWLRACGVHGSFWRIPEQLELLGMDRHCAARRVGDVVQYAFPKDPRWDGHSNWKTSTFTIEAPEKYDRVALLFRSLKGVVKRLLLWDGCRELYDWESEETWELPWVPLGFEATYDDTNSCWITAPWGEQVRFLI